MKKSNKRFILKSLLETGFPLEVATLNLFTELDMDPHPSEQYTDSDTQKNREIDLHVLDFYPTMDDVFIGEKVNSNRLIVHYIVECKNNSHPWIFFTNNSHHWISTFELDISMHKNFQLENDLIQLALNKFHGREKMHMSFTEIPVRDKSYIYDSISVAIKASRYFKKRYVADHVAHLFVPLVIVSGKLWSANMDGKKSKSSIKLKEKNYIAGNYNLIDNDNDNDDSALYFVVTENYLKKFLTKFRKVGKVIDDEWVKVGPKK